MKIENNCIKFKSEPEMYKMEESGSKPNTIRMLNLDEYYNLSKNLNRFSMNIEITNSETGHLFRRTLLSIVNVSKYFDVPDDDVMVVFSWVPFHREGDA